MNREHYLVQLKFSSPVPIYAQLVDEIRRLISRGFYKPGDKLPSVRELAIRLGINPNTVAKAYEQLVADGIARVQKGIGIFVETPRSPASRQREELSERLSRIISDAVAMGLPQQDLHRLFLRAARDAYGP
jgi:GntR family transcriptional regulator